MKQYDLTLLNNQAMDLRMRFGADSSGPVDVFALASGLSELTLVRYSFKGNISGACMKLGHSNLIAINSSQSIGRQRFSLAHELYHLFYDNTEGQIICAGAIGKGSLIERKADQFASFFLIPSVSLWKEVNRIRETGNRLSMLDILRLEQFFAVSHQAMLIRLLDEGYITQDELDSMQSGIISFARQKGFDTSLYEKNADVQNRVFGHYIEAADELFSKEIISSAKFDELLLDAYRDDIVFGEMEFGGSSVD